ncbi:MAG: tetratricopeptide repeat protein [Cytophagaceae bacterium]|jgi:tetratricopeptide (TPR) repeat protein|nr:tetratricopeptide repeat protein [Cytophagaceae bacterium]
MDRIQQLLEFLKEDPSDTFSIYGLALEYWSIDRHESWRYFQQLLDHFPLYSPTYYHAAKFQREEGNAALAEALYRKGIEVCQKEGNQKALRELRSALEEMLFDME